jgi:chromosome segregation ATPase
MEGAPKKQMPERWKQAFDSIATKMEALVMQIRETELCIEDYRAEMAQDENEYQKVMSSYDASDPRDKRFIDIETGQYAKSMAMLHADIDSLTRAIEAMEAKRQEYMREFESLTEQYKKNAAGAQDVH